VTVPALFKLKVAFRQHLPHPGPHRSSKGQSLLLETLLEQLLYPRIHNVDSLWGTRHNFACMTAHDAEWTYLKYWLHHDCKTPLSVPVISTSHKNLLM